jgi:23S rRNA (guanosine2251-2'-O)-methyltransferase
MQKLAAMGYALIGLDGTAQATLGSAIAAGAGQPLGLVLGAEGAGLRQRTRALCGALARINAGSEFGSLNVSNAAAVALYAASERSANTKTPV